MVEEVKRYNLAMIMVKDHEILCNGTKETIKDETNKKKCLSSYEPYDMSFGESDYSLELSEIDIAERRFFLNLRREQRRKNPDSLFTVAFYDFDDDGGAPVEATVYYKCHITEISFEDVNGKFSVKCDALSMKE